MRMYRYRFSILGSISLIVCLICVLAGCSENKIVENSSKLPNITPTQQNAKVIPVSPQATETKPVQEPSPSPSQILFLRIDPKRSTQSDQSRDIWVMDSDGSNAVNLTKGSANAESADWSPDKSKIVFDSVDYESCYIYTMNTDGSNVNRISPGTSSRYFPAWSPDGSKIANSNYFAALCNGSSCSYFQLFTFNQDGAEDGPISFSPVHGYQLLPRWFSDSKRIAFLDFGTGSYEIESGNITTGNLRQYNIEGNTSYMPWFSLSPDGTQIVYSHDFSQDYMHTGRELFLLTLIPVKQLDLQIMTMPMITLVFLLMADK